MEWPSNVVYIVDGIHFFKAMPEFIPPCSLSVSQGNLTCAEHDGTDDSYAPLLSFLALSNHLANIPALFILNPCVNVLPAYF